MDANVRPYLDAFLVAIFPVLQVYLILLLKSQIEKLHNANNNVSNQVTNVQSTVSRVETAVEVAHKTTPLPPAKGE